MELSNNKILITGGASGIGLGLVERFLKENNTVIICGRRADVLKQVSSKDPKIIARVADLSNVKDRVDLCTWILKEHADLNVLVNNAGIQNWMHISEKDFYAKALMEIETNVTAPLHLTSLLMNLKSLRTIINVTSGLAFVQLSRSPVYCATKAFLHSFTMSLRHMVKLKGIEVIELIPPALNTDLGGKGIHATDPPVSDFMEAVFQQLTQGKREITWGFSEVMYKASSNDVIAGTFARLNP
jgi:uncharacterized oxidoreductase